jgi:hypothetical protein
MAQFSAQLSVTTSTPVRLWQTSTGVSPDPQTTLAGSATAQIFRAGTFNDPVPIIIENTDGTNPIYLGPSTVTSSTGTKLAAGGSFTRNVVGNDSEYAISTGGTVVVAVEVSRQ